MSSLSRRGKRMSLYGKCEVNPEEMAGLLKNVKRRTDAIRTRHLAVVGGDSTHWPGTRAWTDEELSRKIANHDNSYFGKRTKRTVADVNTPYMRLFHIKDGYDCKMHRDDRKSVTNIGCSVHDEEKERLVPLLSSSSYGQHLSRSLEPFVRNHVRIMHVVKGFYYKRGTGLPPLAS